MILWAKVNHVLGWRKGVIYVKEKNRFIDFFPTPLPAIVTALIGCTYLYFGLELSGLALNCSWKTHSFEKLHPTGKVSPTTAHWGTPHSAITSPRSWMRPVRWNQSNVKGDTTVHSLHSKHKPLLYVYNCTFVWMSLSYSLGCLKGVDWIGNINLGKHM